MITSEQGALTTLHCALNEAAARESGLYYADQKLLTPSKTAQDLDLAKRLWSHSERWIVSA